MTHDGETTGLTRKKTPKWQQNGLLHLENDRTSPLKTPGVAWNAHAAPEAQKADKANRLSGGGGGGGGGRAVPPSPSITGTLGAEGTEERAVFVIFRAPETAGGISEAGKCTWHWRAALFRAYQSAWASRTNKTIWPSGLRRQFKALVFGRGFESHSGHLFLLFVL